MKIKIFKGNNFQEAIDKCLEAGYKPQTAKQVYKLLEQGKIETDWYDTITFFNKGELYIPTKKEFKNIKALFDKGMRSWYLGRLYGRSIVYGNVLDDDTQLVGVKK